MGKTLDEMIATMSPEAQERIQARYLELREEVESLRELRKLAGKVQADIAAALRIKQPSVSRIEKQTDMYLSTLRGYVEAIGGELELIVRLPSHKPLRLHQLSDVFPDVEDAPQTRTERSPPQTKTKAARAPRKAA